MLAACAPGGPLPLDAEGPGRAVPIDYGAELPVEPAPDPGEVLGLTGAGGEVLPASRWQAEAPSAVILALHGFGDYGPLTFSRAARAWAKAGITTYAYDQRGFGRGETRGRWPGAEALAADLVAAAADVRARHPCMALVVVGHSMGGGVALAAAGQGLDADALVLAAPAIWGGAEMNPFHRLGAWLAAAVVPERRFTGEGVVRIQASDNIPLLRRLGRDPLYLRPPSAREIMGLVRVTDVAEAAAEGVGMPALMLLGEKDEIVPERAVRRVFARLPGETAVTAYPEGWHLLFRDLQAPRVWQDVADWALARPGPARYADATCPVEGGPGAGTDALQGTGAG